MIDQHFVILGALISLLGGGKYAIDTFRGKTQPNRVTWVLWTLAPLVAFAAEIGKGVGLQSLMTFMVGFAPLLVVIASFANKKAVWKATGFDILCGSLSLLGLGLWLLTREGDIAIFFSIVADGLAALPTIVKSYRYPETESSSAFFTGGANAAITLLTIDHWTFATYGFPLYILIVCAVLVTLIQFKFGKWLSQKSHIRL
jgi:hypothetical protein